MKIKGLDETLNERGGDLAYQPLHGLGWIYVELTDRNSKTYWLQEGSQARHTTKEVAAAVGVDVSVLRHWEIATDIGRRR